MTTGIESDTSPRMGRKKRWHDTMVAKFPAQTFTRIAAILTEKEDRTDFVRDAVERELERREHKAAKPKRRKRSE
jgi:hypothetical protein